MCALTSDRRRYLRWATHGEAGRGEASGLPYPGQVILAGGANSVLTLNGPVLVVLSVVVTVAVLVARRFRGRDDPLALVFRGAPVADAVVTAQEPQEETEGARRLYRLTYRVRTAEGEEFTAWEEKFLLPDSGAPAFAVGTEHRVAYRLGSDQVRARTRRRG